MWQLLAQMTQHSVFCLTWTNEVSDISNGNEHSDKHFLSFDLMMLRHRRQVSHRRESTFRKWSLMFWKYTGSTKRGIPQMKLKRKKSNIKLRHICTNKSRRVKFFRNPNERWLWGGELCRGGQLRRRKKSARIHACRVRITHCYSATNATCRAC